MRVVKEFLESSTIHGLSRISSAKVRSFSSKVTYKSCYYESPRHQKFFLYLKIMHFQDKSKTWHNCQQDLADPSWQMCLGFCGSPWFFDGRLHHWQLLHKMATVPNLHLIHDPSDQLAWVSNCDSLSTPWLKHSLELWPSQGWKSILVWKRSREPHGESF